MVVASPTHISLLTTLTVSPDVKAQPQMLSWLALDCGLQWSLGEAICLSL